MGDKTEEILNQRAESPAQVPGLEVGWTQYDRYTNGGQGGDLIIVCAPSKTGKSVTLTNWATKIGIKDRIPVLYFDTEMNEREQEDRILANLTGIPHDEIVSGMYVLDTVNGTASEKIARLKVAREELKLGQYYHIYLPQFNIEKVTALSRKFVTQMGVKAIFFDYIKIPSNQADFKSVQEFQQLGFFTSGLKDLAGILKVPVFSACQTNRSDNATDSPSEANIGGSYRILQLATKLMFLFNKPDEKIAKDGFQNGNQQLFIKFQRNGMSDCPAINIMFNKPILRQQEC
jgi:replicative DNA helicase